jgi:hypothetical protein
MRPWILFVLVAVGSELLVPADGKPRHFTTWGPSACSKWIQARNDKDELKSAVQVIWMEGYLSSLNANSSGKDVLGEVDDEVLEDWLDAYCKLHPNGSAMDAAEELFAKLAK